GHHSAGSLPLLIEVTVAGHAYPLAQIVLEGDQHHHHDAVVRFGTVPRMHHCPQDRELISASAGFALEGLKLLLKPRQIDEASHRAKGGLAPAISLSAIKDERLVTEIAHPVEGNRLCCDQGRCCVVILPLNDPLAICFVHYLRDDADSL